MVAETPVERLLQRLNQGDETAAAEAFVALTPLLRTLVRRQIAGRLQSKFDSVDVIQSVWLRLLAGFRERRWVFDTPAQFQAFLVKVTRNRFLEQVRSVHHDLEHEVTTTPSEVATPEAPPSAVAQAHEAWERLLAMCPPAHQPLLRMRQEGLPLAEIARRSGLHESSVRRIFYDLSRQFVGVSQQQTSADS